MKKKVLLIDESLTVQKVVALTLDKSVYSVWYAKTRSEAMQLIGESLPDLIMVSDQVKDIAVASFPKEVESWVGRLQPVPPIILITAQESGEHRHYNAVLRKPFTPRELQHLVGSQMGGSSAATPSHMEREIRHSADQLEDSRLEKKFNETFSDESVLAQQSVNAPNPRPADLPRAVGGSVRAELPPDVWDTDESSSATGVQFIGDDPVPFDVESASDPGDPPLEGSGLWKIPSDVERPSFSSELRNGRDEAKSELRDLEALVKEKLDQQSLLDVVDKVLNQIVPPIVERLVQERLDKLLKDQEQQFSELKP